MIYAYTRTRYQVSVYRTIGPLVSFHLHLLSTWSLSFISRLIPSGDRKCRHFTVIMNLSDYDTSSVIRKPVFGISDQVPHKWDLYSHR